MFHYFKRKTNTDTKYLIGLDDLTVHHGHMYPSFLDKDKNYHKVVIINKDSTSSTLYCEIEFGSCTYISDNKDDMDGRVEKACIDIKDLMTWGNTDEFETIFIPEGADIGLSVHEYKESYKYYRDEWSKKDKKVDFVQSENGSYNI